MNEICPCSVISRASIETLFEEKTLYRKEFFLHMLIKYEFDIRDNPYTRKHVTPPNFVSVHSARANREL